MNVPLATKLKPRSISEFIGQDHLVGRTGPIKRMLETGKISSMIFYGPPGSGKTSLAEIIAYETNSKFYSLSAVRDGKQKLIQIIAEAERDSEVQSRTSDSSTTRASSSRRRSSGGSGDSNSNHNSSCDTTSASSISDNNNNTTSSSPEQSSTRIKAEINHILFVDEIHRWSKTQQDALLPVVESGLITLIGATTENPSFTVIAPLLSRSRVYVFNPHSSEELMEALNKALKILGKTMSSKVQQKLIQISNQDMRFLLNTIELASELATDKKEIELNSIEQATQRSLNYDKDGEEHYNLISAVHKSLRSSNADAACYWIMRMLAGGEDPLYIARRLVRFASEDIGNANPNALLLANQVYTACQNLGMPECDVALIQLAQYLANCPKDNSAYLAAGKIRAQIKQHGNLPVPLHLRNAPTELMKEWGYGSGYEYDHNLASVKSDQQCLPDKLKNIKFFAE